jgi:DNA-binding transcriptional ArsR family regulator
VEKTLTPLPPESHQQHPAWNSLRAAGLVEAERYGYWTYYRLRPEALRTLAGHLHALAGNAPTGTACRRAVDAATPTAPASSRSNNS